LFGDTFNDLFERLVENYNVDQKAAFLLTSRVFRGGGFTKDHLYLKGFKQIFDAYREDSNIGHLLIGKTSIEYSSIIKEMLERQLLFYPVHTPRPYVKPVTQKPIIDFVINNLK